MGTQRRASIGGGTLIVVLIGAYPLLPQGLRDVWYDGVGLLSMTLAGAGVRHHRSTYSRAWLLVLGGFLGWVVGDVLSSVEQSVWHLTSYPAPSDAIFLLSYLTIGAGLLAMVRGRRQGRDFTVALDAAIVASGLAVLAGVFLIAPIAQDSTLTLAGKLVSSAYPAADLVLVAILLRLWNTPGARSFAFYLLVAALSTTLVSDIAWNISVVSTGSVGSATWNDMLWLLGYALAAAACWSPSMAAVAEPAPVRIDLGNTRLHLFALSGGLALPAFALLLDGILGGPVQWQIVGVGTIVLSALVLTRVAVLVKVVQVQAVQLAALARSDGLTGAPNRRTWDHELSRACQVARETGDSLCVALIDLDHFKVYNDTRGHQRGDLLLREAVAGWSDLLVEGELLARYGGEEFAVLLPGRTLAQAHARLEVLRPATPDQQTFSAGIATWDPFTDPAEVVAAADAAMYRAKRSGRDRICLADSAQAPRVPTPVIFLQDIVDLHTGAVVAVEALSRFDGEDAAAVFERARQSGAGPELEATAIRAALLCRPPGIQLSLNVSLGSLTDPHLLDALAGDLHGITLEITEHTNIADPAVDACLADVRRRGALLAVDDWGQGFSNLDRLLRLRPEVVKLDLSLVQHLDSDYHRATIKSITTWADEVGVRVCAEGVETEDQRLLLTALGVHSAQGYLFGIPSAPPHVTAARLMTTTTPRA